jgi:putative hemin transport protein
METTPSLSLDPSALRRAWLGLRATRHLCNDDAAALLGVSEAELLASNIGAGVTRLTGDFRELVELLPLLGPVRAQTCNAACVHEAMGRYKRINTDGPVGFVVAEEIDLRLLFMHWALMYAVEEATLRGMRHSLQFFDAQGHAVHKVLLIPESDHAAYERLIAEFAAANQAPREELQPPPAPMAARPDNDVDIKALRVGWANLRSTHEFFAMLKKFDLERLQALRLAGGNFATRVPNRATRRLFDAARGEPVEIMACIGNRGCIQIRTAAVTGMTGTDAALEVAGAGFKLSLREDRIAESWIVRKPTSDGIVSSLELFDAAGDTVAMFFGKRERGEMESPAWRALLRRAAGAGCGPCAKRCETTTTH